MNKPIRKLNRRLITICLIASTVVAIPLLIFPMMKGERAQAAEEKLPLHANIDAREVFALSGTDRFPENYGEVKGFEKELKKDDDKSLEKAFEAAEQNILPPSPSHQPQVAYANYVENPWHEAKNREQKQQAYDHYEARRSDILFVNHKKDGSKSSNTIDTAKNHNDLLLVNNAQQVGKVKDALPYMISEGTLIHAILLSEIDTGLPGPILARVSYNIWDSKTGQTLLIPQNSKLIGEYSANIGTGQSRAQILWKRIIFPNQQSVDLGSMVGVDKKGVSGSRGVVDNHYDKVALGLIMTTVLGGAVRMTQGKYDPNSATIAQGFGNSLAEESARLGNKITDKMLAIPPTIKVPMGERLNVFVEQDLSLQPYSG